MAYDPTVWQPDELKRDSILKVHITDRIESAINQITDAKNLVWTIDCISDIVDSEGPKIIFTEKTRYPEHKPESMSIRLKSIWDEITEKNLWHNEDKVMDIYTERIIKEVEAWLDYLAEKRKEQPSVDISKSLPGFSCAVKIDGPDDAPADKKTMTKAEFYSFLLNKDVQKTLMHIGDGRHLMGYLVQEKRIDGEVWFEYSCTDSIKGPYRISMTDYYERNHEKIEDNPASVLADLKVYVEDKLNAMLFLDKDFHVKEDTSEARELNRNMFALLIMTKGASRLTRLAERRNMKVKYDGQERSVTFYKSGLKPIAMAITIRMDDFVDSMSNELLYTDDDQKVSWFTEYCDQTIEKHIYDQSSKELYKSCNSVPKEWINQFIEESAYFEDFMHASINTIVELIQFIRMKEREVEEDNDYR